MCYSLRSDGRVENASDVMRSAHSSRANFTRSAHVSEQWRPDARIKPSSAFSHQHFNSVTSRSRGARYSVSLGNRSVEVDGLSAVTRHSVASLCEKCWRSLRVSHTSSFSYSFRRNPFQKAAKCLRKRTRHRSEQEELFPMQCALQHSSLLLSPLCRILRTQVVRRDAC